MRRSHTHDKSSLSAPSRNPETMALLTEKLEDLEFFKITTRCGPSSLSVAQKNLEALGHHWGVVPGKTLLPQLYEFIPKSVSTFRESLPYDILHSFGKGPSEYAVTHCLQILICISKSTKSKLPQFVAFTDVCQKLNNLIAHFPCKHALEPTRFVQFAGGITRYMKCSAQQGSKQGRGTGLLSAGFPAFHIPCMMLQLLFCLCCGGEALLPNYPCIETTTGIKYNPTQVIVGTLSAVLEVHFMVAAKALNLSQLETMDLLIENMNIWLNQLYDMKQTLLRAQGILKTIKKDNSRSEVPKNIKMHGVGHLPKQYQRYGANSKAFDTEEGEHALMESGKGAFSRCSKHFDKAECEMLLHVRHKEFARNLVKMQCVHPDVTAKDEAVEQLARQTSTQSTKSGGVVSPEKDYLEFTVVSNMGKTELEYTTSGKFLVETKAKPTRYCHPLLTYPELFGRIVALMKQSDQTSFFKSWYQTFVTPTTHLPNTSYLNLRGGIRCKGHIDTDIKEFYIRANVSCRGKGEHTFSFLEVLYAGDRDTSFVKVLAIVECISAPNGRGNPGEQKEIYVIVTRMRRSRKTTILPFDHYEFEFSGRGGQLGLDILKLSCISRPAFMVPSDLRRRGIESTSDYTRLSWVCIPFTRCVKTDNRPYGSYVAETVDGIQVFRTKADIDLIVESFNLAPASTDLFPTVLDVGGETQDSPALADEDCSENEEYNFNGSDQEEEEETAAAEEEEEEEEEEEDDGKRGGGRGKMRRKGGGGGGASRIPTDAKGSAGVVGR